MMDEGSDQGQALQALYARLPLPKGSDAIRVLDLQISSSLADPLKGALRILSLDEGHGELPFHALSYVWGAYSNPPDLLLVDNVPIPITRNCRDALRRTRQLHSFDNSIDYVARSQSRAPAQTLDETTRPIVLWVDAICINQKDEDEKQRQIPLMRDIYMRTERAYFWIGEGTGDSDVIMDCIRSAAHLSCWPDWALNCSVSPPGIRQLMAFTWHISPFMVVMRMLINSFFNPLICGQLIRHDFGRFISRPWFYRSWTLQEAILPPRATVICGAKEIPWDLFLIGTTHIYDSFINRRHILSSKDDAKLDDLEIPGLTELHFMWLFLERSNVVPRRGNGNLEMEPGLHKISCYERMRLYLAVHRYATMVGHRILRRVLTYLFWVVMFLPIYAPIGMIVPQSKPVSVVVLVIFGWIPTPFIALNVIFLCTFLAAKLLVRESPWIAYSLPTGPFPKQVHQRPKNPSGGSDKLEEGVMRSLIERQSTEAKDKAYSEYGILDAMGLKLVAPDYSKSKGRVYHKFFTDLIRWRPQTAEMIMDAGPWPLPDAPSWVPDWSRLTTNFLPDRRLGEVNDGKPRPRKAAGDSLVHASIDGNGLVLVVKGYLHSKIASCFTFRHIPSDSPTAGTSDADVFHSVLSFALWMRSVDFHAPLYSTHMSLNKKTPVTTYALLCRRTPSIDVHIPQGFRDLYQVTNNASADITGEDEEARQMEVERMVLELQRNKEAWDYFRFLSNGLAKNKWCLFTTTDDSGGIATSELVKPGQHISLVSGLHLPIVLREAEYGQGAKTRDGEDSHRDSKSGGEGQGVVSSPGEGQLRDVGRNDCGKRYYKISGAAYVYDLVFGFDFKEELVHDIALI